MSTATPDDIRTAVKDRYAQAARTAAGGTTAGDPQYTAALYPAEQRDELPGSAVLASLGCGNPTLLAELRPGQTVLDLGSGGGIDVLLSARRVAPTGKAFGLDMTGEMLDLARRNQREAGITNAEFLHGTIEQIPLPDEAVDVIISNCVINLSADKGRVLREAFRVLRPGGRFAVSDIVVRGAVPAALRRSLELWAGCVAGALEHDEYLRLLGEAGFVDATIESTRVYTADDVRPLAGQLAISDTDVAALDGAFFSGFVRASKPRT